MTVLKTQIQTELPAFEALEEEVEINTAAESKMWQLNNSIYELIICIIVLPGFLQPVTTYLDLILKLSVIHYKIRPLPKSNSGFLVSLLLSIIEIHPNYRIVLCHWNISTMFLSSFLSMASIIHDSKNYKFYSYTMVWKNDLKFGFTIGLFMTWMPDFKKENNLTDNKVNKAMKWGHKVRVWKGYSWIKWHDWPLACDTRRLVMSINNHMNNTITLDQNQSSYKTKVRLGQTC